MQIDQKLTYNKDKITLLLSVTVPGEIILDAEKDAKEHHLVIKPDFHITLIGYATGQKIQEILLDKTEQEKEVIIEKIQSIANVFTWPYTFLSEYFYITKTYDSGEVRQSIISLVDLPDLEKFYKNLEGLIGRSFDIPFPHITLYTQSTEIKNTHAGIGIYSEREFQKLLPKKIS